MDIELIGMIVFFILLALVLWLHRKKIVLQKILFPFIYIAMLKTSLGIKAMDKIAGRFGKALKYIGYFGILIGFIGMVYISYYLVKVVIGVFINPGAETGVMLVLPFAFKGTLMVPFFYWLISLLIIVIVHEFAHGIYIRLYGVKVKSSGFAVFSLLAPLIPMAFVEPDEKELAKKPAKQQLSVYAAGPFANILLAFLLALILNFLIAPAYLGMYERNGVAITEFQNVSALKDAGVSKGEVIVRFGENKIDSVKNLSDAISPYKPGEAVQIATDKGEYNVRLMSNPDNSSLPYMGIFLEQNTRVNEKYDDSPYLTSAFLWLSGDLYKHDFYKSKGLILWLYLLNFGIGLFNLLPLGPIDGGRMFKVLLEKVLKKEHSRKIFNFIGIFFLLVLIFLIASPILKAILK